MRFLYSVIFLLVIAGTGCSKNNIAPNQEETEVNPFQEIEEKYGISISDKENITKLLHVVESGTTLSVNYLKSNNEIYILVFDTESKKELVKFNLNKESVIVGKDDNKKELRAAALTVTKRMSDYLYGYLYFSEIGSVDIDSYQLFSSKINSNNSISNNIFGADYYPWAASGMAYNFKEWREGYLLIESNNAYPVRQNGYYILDKNNEIVIDGSAYTDYSSGLNLNGIITYNKTAVIISNGLYIYDLETNTYHQIDINIDENEVLGIENIRFENDVAIVGISLTNGSNVEMQNIAIDLNTLN